MGKLTNYRTMTVYIDPVLYERVRATASTLHEDIYEFTNEALAEAIGRRITNKITREAIEHMSKVNVETYERRKAAKAKEPSRAKRR